jgi:hypothetical protein
MTLSEILFRPCQGPIQKIKQVDWPDGTYFVPINYHCPEYVEGWMYKENKCSTPPYGFYFGGKSNWEEVK